MTAYITEIEPDRQNYLGLLWSARSLSPRRDNRTRSAYSLAYSLGDRVLELMLLEVASDTLLSLMPRSQRILDTQLRTEDDRRRAEQRCHDILMLCDGDMERFKSGVEAWVHFSMEYFRRQAEFVRTGKYGHSDFEQIRTELYDDDERMKNYYLMALLFSFVFSANYSAFYVFFEKNILPRASHANSICDVGCGHGLYLAILMQASKAKGIALDISPASLDTCRKVLQNYSIAEDRIAFDLVDLRGTLPVASASQDLLICCEVIEHLPDPVHALRELRRIATHTADLMLTTAIRMESVDHLHLFQTPEEVFNCISDAGWNVCSHEIIPLSRENIHDPQIRKQLIETPTVSMGFVAHCTPSEVEDKL